jgi:putative membrane protein
MTEPHESSRSAKPDAQLRLAAERTLLAWVRTGLAMMGFGFVVARFSLFLRELAAVSATAAHHATGPSLWIGTALVVAGVAATFTAAVQHVRLLRRLDRGEAYRAPFWSLALVVAGVLALIGLAMAVYLVIVST